MKHINSAAIDGKDYIGGEFKLTFSPGQSMSGNNSQCIDLIIINDHLLEHNETLLILLNSTKEDANIVKVSSAGAELLLTILEISPSDSMLFITDKFTMLQCACIV